MALPVIANVSRVTLEWSASGGIHPANVWHFFAPTGDEQDLSNLIEANFNGDMIDCVSSNFAVEGVTVLRLDGTSASQSFVFATAVPGQGGGDYAPALCGLVKLQTPQRGPRGRGRMYVGPCAESANNEGLLDAGSSSAMASGWATFLPAMASATAPLVIASYQHADNHQVTAVTVESILATQKRRQDQLR
jgi:hypothetical protein